MDIELITLINSFRNTIALNNLLIKEKILRKLDMIHTMRWYGFPLMNFPESKCNNIIQELQRIDKTGDIVKYSQATNNSDTNKLLGDILHNAFQTSGYDIILSNAPIHGTTISGDFIQLDSEAIYDTLSQYATVGAVQSVMQVAGEAYLIKMNTKENARALCYLLNKKLMGGKIIKVEYIKPLQLQITNQIDTIDSIDDIDTSTDSHSNKIIEIIDMKSNIFNNATYFAWFLNMFSGFLHRLKSIKQNINWTWKWK